MAIATGAQALASDVVLGANLKAECVIGFKGAIADIPAGWVICDGNNGTDNMLARFPKQVATAATEAGTTGGSTAKTMTVPGTLRTSATEVGTGLVGAGDVGAQTHSDIRPLWIGMLYIMKT